MAGSQAGRRSDYIPWLHIPDDALRRQTAYGPEVGSRLAGSGGGDDVTGSGPTREMTVTQQLLEVAATYGSRPALVGSRPDQDYTFGDLASTIQRAAAGLAWRGLRSRDVVGVYVPDAVAYVLACHSISAAGGIPCPVSAELSIAEAAGQLADCGARMLLTAQPLAAAGLAAADRSWVRQVISFGEAPAATPFTSLLGMGSLHPPSARPHDLALLPYVRHADGALHPAGLTHLNMVTELSALSSAAEIGEDDVVLAAPPAGDGRSYTAFVDHALINGATVVAACTDELAAAATEHHGTAAIVPLGVEVNAAEKIRLFAVAS
jgi:acyl-CoA synthetase (AMP-forming)/AMP-acid ligase II